LKGQSVNGSFKGGHGAALRVVRLMRETVKKLSPEDIVRAYNEEKKPAARVERLWKDFGTLTIDRIAAGCLCMADIWASAWKEGGGEQNGLRPRGPGRPLSQGLVLSVDVAREHDAAADVRRRRQRLTRLTPSDARRERTPQAAHGAQEGREGLTSRPAVATKGGSSHRRYILDGMIKVGSIVIRVDDLAKQTAFWTAALDYVPRAENSDDFVLLRPKQGGGPNISLDRQRSSVQIPPRIHLDLYADDQTAAVARLLSLGATEVRWDKRPADADYVILADPEGNRFCVIDASR
jgi:hypothetical protein